MRFFRPDKVTAYKLLFPLNIKCMMIADIIAVLGMPYVAEVPLNDAVILFIITLGNVCAQVVIYHYPKFFEVKKANNSIR